MLPGLDGTGAMFRPFLEAAPAGSSIVPRVVRYPDREVRSYVGLEPTVEASLPSDRPFVLLGESFGGPLSIRVAARAPTGLRALILVATFARAPVNPWLSRLSSLARPALFSIPPPAPFLRQLLVGPDAEDALVEEFQASTTCVHPAVLAARVQAVLRVDVREELARCPVPALYLEANAERLLRRGLSAELRALKPDLEIARVDAPHLLLQRNPKAAWSSIESFVRRLS